VITEEVKEKTTLPAEEELTPVPSGDETAADKEESRDKEAPNE
jgi:hypothetical protein